MVISLFAHDLKQNVVCLRYTPSKAYAFCEKNEIEINVILKHSRNSEAMPTPFGIVDCTKKAVIIITIMTHLIFKHFSC